MKASKATPVFFSIKNRWVVLAIGVVSIIAVYSLVFGRAVSVDTSTLLVDHVKHGELDITVEAYGQLKPEKQRLITASSDSVVKEIHLKPGAKVTIDTVILKLENIALEQEVFDAKQLLAQARENLEQQRVANERETLNERANLEQIEAESEIAELRRTAESKLVEQGIVSQLTYQSSNLNAKHLRKRFNIAQKKLDSLKRVQLGSLKILSQKVEQRKEALRVSMEKLAKLEVKAGFEGRLQRVSVELGQSVTIGQELVLVGSEKDLIAELKVSQSQAQDIAVGQSVVISTRRDEILGEVSLIDPIVVKNAVRVEVKLNDALPASARPYLNVDGKITTQHLEGVAYIKRPVNLKTNGLQSLYRLTLQEERAERISVEFGMRAGQYVQVLSGAKPGDQLILSDLSELSEGSTKYITLN